MSWLIEHKRVWRAAILMLLLLASIGPWAFDRIVVPAEYACSAPFIRLKGDFCGTPLSGVWILLAVVGEAIRIVGSLVTGTSTFGEVGRLPLIVLLVLLPLLSFSSTLFLILAGDRPRRYIFHIAVWSLAVVSTVWLLLSVPELPATQIWGLWLYIGLAPSVLVLESIALAFRKSLNPAG